MWPEHATLVTDAVQGHLARLNNLLAPLDNSVAGFSDYLSNTIDGNTARELARWRR